jgi:tetratricopeptide (TPR) repeat protein
MPLDSDENQARLAREAELSEVLSSYADPRAVSYRFVTGFVLLGLLLCASVALAGARSVRQVPFRFEAAPPASFERGVAAYERGDWEDALKAMREAAKASPAPRIADYVERLNLVHRDGERLAKAEEALDADEPERALVLAALVAPNSPLFAQAEGLGRKARARMELDMRTDPLVREELVVVDPQPEPALQQGKQRAASGKKGSARVKHPPRVQEPSYEGEW